MKKNLIIFMPSIEGGGVEKNLFIISNYLSNKLKNATIITSTNKFNNKFNNINIINPSFRFKKHYGRKLRYFFCLLLLIKLIFKQNKSVLVLAFQANLYCAIICKIFNVKIITRSNSSPSGWSNNFIKKFIYRIFLKIPNQVIVNSIEFKHELKKKFNVNSICIFNPLNKKEILKKSKEKVNLNFFNVNKKIIKIIFVGRFVDQKDPLTFLKALTRINNKIEFRALMIGRGILKKRMVNFIKINKLNKKIKLLNFQNNPYKYIEKSDLLVLTSKFEGLPNVLLEAQVLKKFIISSNCPTGPKEILLNGNAGLLFEMNNFEELANKIQYFSCNRLKLREKINNGTRNINRFDYYKSLNKYLKVVNKLI
jgi:glycosyltransferase involved in cell wall biosynthesis